MERCNKGLLSLFGDSQGSWIYNGNSHSALIEDNVFSVYSEYSDSNWKIESNQSVIRNNSIIVDTWSGNTEYYAIIYANESVISENTFSHTTYYGDRL